VLLVGTEKPKMIRRRQRKRRESGKKPFGKLKNVAKRNIVKWRKNEKRCGKR
jgi:hypothetical protein